MVLNSNIQWKNVEGRGFFKINGRLIEVCDLDVNTQERYWNIIQHNRMNLDALQEKFNSDTEFNKFFCFIRMIGGLESGSNEWTCFEKRYRFNVNNLDKAIKNLKITLFSDYDLKEFVKKELSDNFIVEEKGANFGIIVGREDNMLSMLSFNTELIIKKIPFLIIRLEPFKISVGPLVIPHMTPCLNCIYLSMIRNQNNTEYRQINSYFPASQQKIPDITIKTGVKIAQLHILKFLIRKEKNQNALKIINNILEYDFYNDEIEWHPVTKDLNCQVCQTKEEKYKSNNWLNVGGKYEGNI
ncbi:TOMM precursor leader peptide-binding protein [Luxibacter massiliensis]|uniref:TOMM precursor leader peptide-binding protein n=1 Tax=Luxibacter massiliensis TaxID=2219695 RepID=UPI000F0597A7|nr:TOMM precursor leader peptide-binding protein [Luxibacter massiliensis]